MSQQLAPVVFDDELVCPKGTNKPYVVQQKHLCITEPKPKAGVKASQYPVLELKADDYVGGIYIHNTHPDCQYIILLTMPQARKSCKVECFEAWAAEWEFSFWYQQKMQIFTAKYEDSQQSFVLEPQGKVHILLDAKQVPVGSYAVRIEAYPITSDQELGPELVCLITVGDIYHPVPGRSTVHDARVKRTKEKLENAQRNGADLNKLKALVAEPDEPPRAFMQNLERIITLFQGLATKHQPQEMQHEPDDANIHDITGPEIVHGDGSRLDRTSTTGDVSLNQLATPNIIDDLDAPSGSGFGSTARDPTAGVVIDQLVTPMVAPARIGRRWPRGIIVAGHKRNPPRNKGAVNWYTKPSPLTKIARKK